MPATLLIRDETTRGETTGEMTLDFLEERITVRELIRSRVFQEVKDHNARKASPRSGSLVEPTDAERRLNPSPARTGEQIDWQKPYEVALDAFETGRFLILIDDRQAESLEEQFDVGRATEVTFLKLVPLVGG